MDKSGNTSSFKKLPGDMKREIEKLVHKKQPEDKQLIVTKSVSTELTANYTKSIVWNKSIPGQISLCRVGQRVHENLMCLSTQSLTQGSMQADGPNNANDVLIAGHSPNELRYTTYFLLKKLTESQNRTVQKFPYSTIPGQRLVTMALAASHGFAILGKTPTQAHNLSWYTYNENRLAHLASRTRLPGQLTQVAFITPRIILGLTTGKKLITLWLDVQKKLQFQLHKTPFAVEKFAIDSQNSGLISFIFKGIEKLEVIEQCPFGFRPPHKITVDRPYFAVAVSSLKIRDCNGKCHFKTKKLEGIPKTLDFADGVVIITHECSKHNTYPLCNGNWEQKPTDETICLKVPPTFFNRFIS